MELNLENEGTWFELDDVRIQLRTCTLEEITRIRKATTKKKREFKNGQVYEYFDTDDDTQQNMIMDYCIVAWENITHKNAPLPCTPENKMRVVGGMTKLAKFIREKIEELSRFEQGQEQTELKN